MPTEDYSASLRTARTRRTKSLDGLGKVAGALDNSTQLDINLGGVYEKRKIPGFTCSNTHIVPVGCVGSFSAMSGIIAQGTYTCNGTNCTYNSSSYQQINAIPGTSTSATGSVVIVNCSENVVYLSINGTTTGPIESQRTLLTNNGSVVYSFT